MIPTETTARTHRVRLDDVTPQPWRNGGGNTRELLAWPGGGEWRMRISVADICANGPFSSFEGVQRWFAVLDGEGVVLSFAADDRLLSPSSTPLRFDGADAPGCRLLAGPTRDLNLMLRAGTRGVLRRARDGERWDEPWRWRACFSMGAAQWQGVGSDPVALAAGTLWHPLPPGPCRLSLMDRAAPAYWIGVDLDGALPP